MSTSQQPIPQHATPSSGSARRPSRDDVRAALERLLLGGKSQYGAKNFKLRALRDRIRLRTNDIPSHLLDLFDGRPDDALLLGRILARRSLPMLDVLPFPRACAEETAAQSAADVAQIEAMRAIAEQRPLLAHERTQLRLALMRHRRAIEQLEATLDAEELAAGAS